LDWKVQ